MERYREPSSVSALAAQIGRRVVALRSARGWSMSALAQRAGVGKATLSELEAGVRNPTLETLYAIAAALELPLVELIGRPRAGAPAPVVRGAAVSASLVESFSDDEWTTECYRLVFVPGARQVSPAHGVGVTEHLLVTSGRVRAGPIEAPLEVGAGGHASWESRGEHIYETLSEEAAEAVLLIRHPRRWRPPAL
jgi:transcriptional regulator with XRE-family HTH domain